MGNGLQELAARNVLSKRSVLFKSSEPRRPLPSLALLQSETTNSFHTSCFLGNNLQLLLVGSVRHFLIMPWPLSVYRFFNQTEHEHFIDVIRTNRPELKS